ncbi:MAG: hypothetical protein PHE49_08510 [bacterium]|nr:hypothetical protein [bacterium]
MKTLLSIVAIMATITVAEAKMGIGYDAKNSAVSYKYWAEKVGFQGEARVDYKGAESGATTQASSMTLDFTALVLYPIAKADKFHLNGIAGISYIMNDNLNQVEDRTKTNMGFRIGLSPEYYVTDNFSFECSFGVAISMYGETKNDTVGMKDDYKTLETFGTPLAISSASGISFHFYFPETVKAAAESTPAETPEEEDAE